MRIRLIAVGTKMPGWVTSGFDEYSKRLTQDIQLELVEIPAGKRGKNADVNRILQKEGELILNSLQPQEHTIALDVKGKRFTTEKLSERLNELMHQGQPLALLVGGPEGLAPECRQRASEKWSLSDLTLPHPLVRIVIAEQLYRAWSLLKGHPYHR
ncbi:MAG: 23S rRNA (pseudouridine(1915)-N(3))-methyltransferase RlmH [Ketobacteraceae bacterium]|nr:23S rRNA (pseudouridine(1915)-N(3))-methyltransferase RlmH [Ketobacteraceae bacterium]